MFQTAHPMCCCCHIINECILDSKCYYLFIPPLMNISIASASTHPTNREMVNILVNIPLVTCIKFTLDIYLG